LFEVTPLAAVPVPLVDSLAAELPVAELPAAAELAFKDVATPFVLAAATELALKVVAVPAALIAFELASTADVATSCPPAFVALAPFMLATAVVAAVGAATAPSAAGGETTVPPSPELPGGPSPETSGSGGAPVTTATK